MTTPVSTCPECSGRRLDDVTGLRHDHAVTCSLRTAEDSRAEVDRRLLSESALAPVTRPATPTEVLLGVPAEATVTVSAVTSGLGVVSRSWQ